MSADRQIRQESKQTIKNKQCGSNPPNGVPQVNSHNIWALARQGGYFWPIANWEQKYATGTADGSVYPPARAPPPDGGGEKTPVGHRGSLLQDDAAIPLQRIHAETIAGSFLDYWVAKYGPPATVLSDTGPQFSSTFFQGVCSLLGISNRYSTTYHPQTNGQVERYNRTIVGQLRKYVEDHKDRWDELVSMLTLAYNSRPQQSTGVAPLEFVTPERVRSLSVERMVGCPTPEETDGNPRAIREVIRTRLRNLMHKVRRFLTLAQRRYERNHDARVRPVNKDVQAGDWVFVDGHERTKYKIGTRAAGPYKVLSRGEGTFSMNIGGYPEAVSSDHVTAAPGSPRDPQTLLKNLGVPEDIVVPEGYQHTGKELVWEAFVGHEVADDGTLRQCTCW